MPLRVPSPPVWAPPGSLRRIGLRALAALLPVAGPAAAESGYQVIRGTRVFTVIDHATDTATFSNACGSQTLSHRDLGLGAIPDRIIPCPRPGGPPPPRPTAAPRVAEDHEPGEASDVAGSYARTCRNCTGEAPGLVCECRRIDQTYVRTAIDPDRCAGGEVENLDGRLSCARGPAAVSRRAPTASPQAVARPPRETWVSVAAGLERFSSRMAVATGYARRGSASEARDAATAACARNSSGVSTCEAVGAWNQGCIYIVTTTSDRDGGAVAWGSGPNAQDAYDNCRGQSGVVQCETKAIGGCVE